MTDIDEIKKEIMVDNNEIREKIKKLIKKKNYNLRDLSRNIKKNDAYLQQYLYRGTPKVLPEEYRLKLAKILAINEKELVPSWLKNLFPNEKLFTLKNIENNFNNTSEIYISKEFLNGLDFFDEKNLYYFQTPTTNGYLTTIIDVSIKKFKQPNVYLLKDNKNYFLAFIELSKFNQNKLSVKPYFNSFSPFQINSNLLNITGKILWQCSKVFSK